MELFTQDLAKNSYSNRLVIQCPGGVRRLPFPVPLDMPPVGLIFATRHRETPVVHNLHNALLEIARKRRDA